MGPNHAEVLSSQVEVLSNAANAEWTAFSQSNKDLCARLLDDLSEKHARAALDLADRHMEAARALDARADELSELTERLRNEAFEFRAGFHYDDKCYYTQSEKNKL